MKKCYRFNMVEIALAIAIIAIGISAVLVLFPVGINATRAAMDENSSTDVGEYIAGFVRGQCLAHWKTTYAGWRNDTSQNLSFTVPPALGPDSKPATPADLSKDKFDKIDGYTVETPAGSRSGLQKHGGIDGVYRFNRVTAEGEETFAALVKIWSADLTSEGNQTSANCPVYIPDAANSFEPKLVGSGTNKVQLTSPSGPVDFGVIAQSVMVEISWPADAADEDRTSRTFRVDVYNPYYTIQPEPAAP